jgi:hypothetical protein
MRHVMILGIIGLIAGSAGAIGAVAIGGLGTQSRLPSPRIPAPGWAA